LRQVLLLFFSIFTKIQKEKLIGNIRRKLQDKKIKVLSIRCEERYIVLEVSDPAEARCVLTSTLGIDRIGVARKTRNDYSHVMRAISDIGKEIILPKERFLIRIKLSTNDLNSLNYKERDIEFASAARLTSELSSRGARPAISEKRVDRTIESYIGNRYAYVCLDITSSVGGLPFNSQSQKVITCIHNPLSVLSCMISMRCGFLPQIVLPYIDEEDLRNKVKLCRPIINMIDKRRYQVSLAHIHLPYVLDINIKKMVLESIYYKILTSLSGDILIVSLSAAVSPFWYISSIVRDVISSGKIPWTPSIFASKITDAEIRSNRMVDVAAINGFQSKAIPPNSRSYQPSVLKDMVNPKLYEKYRQIINDVSQRSVAAGSKMVSFNVGSNYIHDIVNSI
jgi:hypothetical protein